MGMGEWAWGLGVGGMGMGDTRNDKRRSDLEEECSLFSTDLTLQLNKSNNSFEVIIDTASLLFASLEKFWHFLKLLLF